MIWFNSGKNAHCNARERQWRKSGLGDRVLLNLTLDGASSSRRQGRAREEMTRPHFLVFALVLLSCVHAGVVIRRETNSLIEAAQEGDLARVRRLVSDAHAPDVNELGPDDRTPLIFAASFGDPTIVQELVQAGALVDFQDSFGWSPLHWAADTGHISVVRWLVGVGANVNVRDTEGWSPLHWAAYRGNMELVQELVEGGADTNLTTEMDRNTKKKYTAWDLASMYGHSEVADFLRQPSYT